MSRPKFDIQLERALKHEAELKRILEGAKIELKTETYKWRKSGNLCIEYKSRGRASCLATTEADYWIHELCADDGRVLIRLMFDVDELKNICRNMYVRGRVFRNGGDGNSQHAVLLSLDDLVDYLMEMAAK